ncbi:MAG TPA: phage tail tube protein [Thermaerobacter sp.]
MNGAQVLVLVKTGEDQTSGQPIYTPVGEQTGLSSEESRDLIEAAAKGDDHMKHLYGRASTQVELEALYVPNDEAFLAIRDAYRNKAEVILRRSEDGQHVEEARAKVESISSEWPDNDSSTVSVTFQLQEPWREVTS